MRRYFDSVDDVRQFRVSQARVARFRAILEPYRPDADTPEPSECRHEVSPQEAPLVFKAVEMEVKWTSAAGSDHLIGCDTPQYAALREALGRALQVLGLEVDARRRD